MGFILVSRHDPSDDHLHILQLVVEFQPLVGGGWWRGRWHAARMQ